MNLHKIEKIAREYSNSCYPPDKYSDDNENRTVEYDFAVSVIEWLSKGHCIVEKDVVKVLYDNIRRNGNMPIKEGDEESIKERLTVLRTVFAESHIDWDSIPEYD